MAGPLLQTFAIARNAFAEAIRQPFYVVWLLTVGGLIILAPYLAAYTFDDDAQFALVMMLSMIQAGGLILAGVLPALVVRREIDNHTAITIVSKPVGRPVFVVGKFLGVAGAGLLVVWSWSVLFWLMDRHGVLMTATSPIDWPVITFGTIAIGLALAAGLTSSYLFRRPFGSAFAKVLALTLPVAWVAVLLLGKGFEPQSPLTDLAPQTLAATVVLWLMVLVMTGVAVAASIRLALVPALVVVIVVAGLGFTSDYFFGTAEFGAGLGQTVQATLYRALPNLQFLFLADALTQGSPITPAYLGYVLGYSALMTVAALCLAVALFQTRQVN